MLRTYKTFIERPTAISLALLILIPLDLHAQNDNNNSREVTALEETIVTGSRIRRDPLNQATAVMEISNEVLIKSGVTNLGDILQDLPISGSAPNSQFNVPGNSGFPQDGGGIGAGSVQLSLRNIGAKRTLVLVDGKRWVAGSSASGVPSTVDLNTIPSNVIQRIEILQDGASAIYGSDAIGGVVNIITNKKFEGFRFDMQTGQYISDGDGESSTIAAMWGVGNDTTHIVTSISRAEEKGILTSDRPRSAFPNANASSCDVPGSNCSSFTPQGRFILGENFGGASITLNDGVLNDGAGNIPNFNPADPASGDFHTFTAADRFNYNGPGFNYLKTPNERTNIFTSISHNFNEGLTAIARASYTKRKSKTQGAPEPLCIGADCGNSISENFVISELNPFNPFGVELSLANGNLTFFGRRPLESGPRLFSQNVDSLFISAGLEGKFQLQDNTMYWDLTTSYGDNRGTQLKQNSHNIAKLQLAMSDPDLCAQVPNCVPFNFFGGQGPNGMGSITEEMLDFVRYTQRDFSEQRLKNISFNITGDIFSVPAGDVAFASGFEYRDHEGSFSPDPIAESGETAGIPSGATTGQFDVTEYYLELSIPVLNSLDTSIAARSSDYSTSGAESTYKASVLWRPSEDISLRASTSTGFRAPGIGELFGGAAREDFEFKDPCADYTGVLGSANGGRDAPQPNDIQSNCAALGVPEGVDQINPQLNALSAGNENLKAETSESSTLGFVYKPDWMSNLEWVESFTASFDYYTLEIENAVQGRDAADIITACVNTLAPEFCDSVPRGSSGRIGLVSNPLQNIGQIQSSGYDIALNYAAPENNFGKFFVTFNATNLQEYKETIENTDGSTTVTDFTGTHTSEVFQRAFPEWRMLTSVDWMYENWSANLAFRRMGEMETDKGSDLEATTFTDLQASYHRELSASKMTFTLGFKNLLDEEPPLCDCGLIGLSLVAHDIPGRVGYLRFSYEM